MQLHGKHPLAPTSYTQLPKNCTVWAPRVVMSSPKGRDGSPEGSVLPGSRDSIGLVTCQPVVPALTQWPPGPAGEFKRVRSILAALPGKETFSNYNLWKQTMCTATWGRWGVPKKVCTSAECRNFKCFLFSTMNTLNLQLCKYFLSYVPSFSTERNELWNYPLLVSVNQSSHFSHSIFTFFYACFLFWVFHVVTTHPKKPTI